jgi:hypothetical protein
MQQSPALESLSAERVSIAPPRFAALTAAIALLVPCLCIPQGR